MSHDLQPGPDGRKPAKEGSKFFALICVYIVLAVTMGVARGSLEDASRTSVATESAATPTP